MPRRSGRLLAAALHGAADALPVSSSGHLAAAQRLLGWDAADDVGLHAGSLAAVVAAFRGEAVEVLGRLTWRRTVMHVLAGGIPAAGGLALERRASWRTGANAAGERHGGGTARGRRRLAGGMLAGAALLAGAGTRRGERSLWDAGPADGLWLGLAQAAALWPGVSRNGTTLAAARLLGFAPGQANRLSREVGAPVTAGAILLRRAPVDAATLASAAGTLAALPLVRIVDRGAPVWPWAAERAVLALVLLRSSAR